MGLGHAGPAFRNDCANALAHIRLVQVLPNVFGLVSSENFLARTVPGGARGVAAEDLLRVANNPNMAKAPVKSG